MKKISSCILAICLSVTCLAGCEDTNKKECDFRWAKTGEGHSKIMLCGCCEAPAVEEPHVDKDADDVCDVCGYVMQDMLMYVWYHYNDEYNSPKYVGIDWEQLEDFSVLVDVSNALTFTEEEPEFFWRKLRYCVRHFDTATDDFFVSGDEEYKDLRELFTNAYADVLYEIDYVHGWVEQKYTTPEGEQVRYAKLSEEQLTAIKTAFQPVADRIEPKEGMFSLSDFEYWIREIDTEDVAKVRMIENPNNPTAFCNVYTTEEFQVIQSVLVRCEEMEMRTVTKEQAQVSGGATTTVEFAMKDGTVHNFSYYAGYYTDGERYFDLMSNFRDIKQDMTKTYRFSVDNMHANLYLPKENATDGFGQLCSFDASVLEFEEIEVPMEAFEPTAMIKMDCHTLVFMDDSTFFIKGEGYYRLIGKTIEDLIEEYQVVPEA